MRSALFLAALVALPSPNPMLPLTIVTAPHARLSLETAATPEQRERGLMMRTALAPNAGMLFVFESDDTVSFWMKNTLLPLDMIFVASDYTVRRVFARVPTVSPSTPDDKIPLETARARYVIELAAGQAQRDGIVPGTHLQFARTP